MEYEKKNYRSRLLTLSRTIDQVIESLKKQPDGTRQ